MKRSEQKEKRRQEILDIGLDLFIQKGYAATRTAEIAKAVKMSEGLLFHYFETKEKLYFALIDIAICNRGSTFELSGLEPLMFFEKAAEYIIGGCAKNHFAAKLFVLMRQAEQNAALHDDIRNHIAGEKQLRESVETVIKGQECGTIRKGDPFALALTFWLSIQGVVENIARNPAHPIPDPAWIVDMLRNNV